MIGSIGVAFLLSTIEQETEEASSETQRLTVETQLVFPQSAAVEIESQGTVQATVETTIMSEVSGVVSYVSPIFVSGGIFKKGDELIHLDPLNYEVRLEQAQAALALARARLLEENARSKAEKDRWTASGKSIKNAPPLLIRTPFIEEAKANVKASEAELRQAKTLLAKTKVKAPYDGIVRTRSANLGQFVSQGANIGSIIKTARVEIRLPVSNSSLPFMQTVEFDIASQTSAPQVLLTARYGQKNVSWPAKIVRREGVIDPQNRLHYFVAEVQDPYGLNKKKTSDLPPLTIGTFVQAKIFSDEIADIFVLPRTLLKRNNELLVVKDGDHLRMQPVNIIYSTAELIYVDKGIEPGEELVVSNVANPIDGTLVDTKPVNHLPRENQTAGGI